MHTVAASLHPSDGAFYAVAFPTIDQVTLHRGNVDAESNELQTASTFRGSGDQDRCKESPCVTSTLSHSTAGAEAELEAEAETGAGA